jgi:hypothetical protein
MHVEFSTNGYVALSFLPLVLMPALLCIYVESRFVGTVEVINKNFVLGKGRWSTTAQAEGLQKTTCYMLFDEECLKERRCLIRGFGALKQLQGMHVYHAVSTHIPQKSRTYYSGTIKYTSWEDSWKLTIVEKVNLYGVNRRAVGGRSDGTKACDDKVADEGDEDDGDDKPDEGDDDQPAPTFSIPIVGAGRNAKGLTRNSKLVEPVAWHAMPVIFYKELIESFYARLVDSCSNCLLASPASYDFLSTALPLLASFDSPRNFGLSTRLPFVLQSIESLIHFHAQERRSFLVHGRGAQLFSRSRASDRRLIYVSSAYSGW